MKIITVIGARPQFIKAAVVSKQMQKYSTITERIIHTGQHFDRNMSEVFFNQLEIPRPSYQLSINGGNHGYMTGRMLIEIETILVDEKPDLMLVYGDTNSTLAGALAASKLHIPVAHIEAGLRSYNMNMPEEINRILTDNVSSYLFCPTTASIDNLIKEGFDQKKDVSILKMGDVMQDSVEMFSKLAVKPESLEIDRPYILATVHRAENTDNIERLKSILEALNDLHNNFAPVILPLHPRTRNIIESNNLRLDINIIDPVGYLEMLWLLKSSSLVLTDSGGIQKESFFFGKPCVTVRDQTEWVELIEVGANILTGADAGVIVRTVKQEFGKTIIDNNNLFGGGTASSKIVKFLSTLN